MSDPSTIWFPSKVGWWLGIILALLPLISLGVLVTSLTSDDPVAGSTRSSGRHAHLLRDDDLPGRSRGLPLYPGDALRVATGWRSVGSHRGYALSLLALWVAAISFAA